VKHLGSSSLINSAVAPAESRPAAEAVRPEAGEKTAVARVASAGSSGRRVLIIVENLPVPFDRRVWSEATTLRDAGYTVSVICPKAAGYEASEDVIDGIHIYRHSTLLEASGALGYLAEYGVALFWELVLALKIARRPGFDVIHACNPPDLIFIVGIVFKIFGRKSFVFDHHDLTPEVYEAKFNRRDLFWKLSIIAERLTFKTANFSIATNESYRHVATTRGGMPPERVFVVRSGPNLERVKRVADDPHWRNGRRFLVGYVGVISEVEGLDLLLAAVDHIVHARRRSDVQFAIVGFGPSWPAITKLCTTLGLDEYVTLTGRIEDAALFAMLSTADVCVNPDRVTPLTDLSTMNKVMEYMALEKPIVQFDVTEGRFSAQGASLYARPNDPVDFGEKILELIDSEQLRKQMGECGLRRVQDVLAWHHEQPKLLSAYDAVFASRKQRAGLYSRLCGVLRRSRLGKTAGS
jgi:glycosyltransferase involved in cell wall biosynthesis